MRSRRMSLPVAVTRMRFLVPLCVLFLDIVIPFTNVQTIFDPKEPAVVQAPPGRESTPSDCVNSALAPTSSPCSYRPSWARTRRRLSRPDLPPSA